MKRSCKSCAADCVVVFGSEGWIVAEYVRASMPLPDHDRCAFCIRRQGAVIVVNCNGLIVATAHQTMLIGEREFVCHGVRGKV